MKNLVVSVCGDNSYHRIWNKSKPDFDLFVVYYGKVADKFCQDGKYYATSKGTKFVILHDIYTRFKEVIDQYDTVFIPDDDMYIETEDINRFFELFNKYQLSLAQPSILGYISWPITANVNFSLLRYTNVVEIMCPCFSLSALQTCLPTFVENKTNWGIEYLWNQKLGSPTDKIAIVDDVVAIHTRPCFFGDTYANNNNCFELASKESYDLLTKYNLSDKHITYGSVEKDKGEFMSRPSERKFLPNCDVFKSVISSLKHRSIGVI